MNTLVRYTHPVSTLSSWLDEMFNDSFTRSDRRLTGTNWPPVDIVESENDYRIHADVPGLEKKDIEVRVENGVLTLKGEKKSENKTEKERGYYHLERSYGAFQRSFTLPDNVDAGSIEAHYKNGVLSLSIRKREEAKPKAIEVKID